MKWIKVFIISLLLFSPALFAYSYQLGHVAGHMNSSAWSLADVAKARKVSPRLRREINHLARHAYRLKKSIDNGMPAWRIKADFSRLSQAFRALNYKLGTSHPQHQRQLRGKLYHVRRRYYQLRDLVHVQLYHYDSAYDHHYGYDDHY